MYIYSIPNKKIKKNNEDDLASLSMWSLFYFFLYIVLVLPGSTRIHCIWPDSDPGKEIEVDPDPDPRRGLKWIRIRPNAVDPGPKRWY